MTALIFHIIWSIAYLIIFLLYNIIITLLFNNDNVKLKQFNNNFFIKFILLIFFNKNLSFYKNILNNEEIYKLELNRLKHWPTINFIHSNINKLQSNEILNNNDLNFKEQFKTYKFLSSNLNISNIINISNANEKIIFSVLNIIIKNNYKILNKLDYNDLLISLFIFKNSISNEFINIKKYNLLKFNDYIMYINNTNLIKNFNKTQLILNNNSQISLLKKNINYKNYNSYINLNNLIEFTNNYFYLKLINNFSNLNININEFYLTDIKQKYLISFSASNIVKYLSDFSINNSTILYLRKNKIFNKSRYSRNRQTYRTGAYWCLYVNIVAVIAFYFWFYKFTMNFGYLWWLLFSLIASFFFSRALKYNFYNPIKVFQEFITGVRWYISIILNILMPLINFILFYKNKIIFNIFIKHYQNNIYYFLYKNKSIITNYIYLSFNFINNINSFIFKKLNF